MDNSLMVLDFELIECPEDINDSAKYISCSADGLMAIGGIFTSLPRTLKTTINTGGKGIYRAILPEGTHLATAQDGAKIGAAIGKKGLQGQARFVEINTLGAETVIPFDPKVFFAIMIYEAVSYKINKLQETQDKVIDFLEREKKAEIQATLNELNRLMKSYKSSYSNDAVRISNGSRINQIKADAEQNMLFYSGRLTENIRRKNKLVSINSLAVTDYGKYQSDLICYRLSLYEYAYAAVLYVLYSGNNSHDYLIELRSELNKMEMEYRVMYSDVHRFMEKSLKASAEVQALSGLGLISKTAGNAIASIPVIRKAPVDDMLLDTSKTIEKTGKGIIKQKLKRFESASSPMINSFEECLTRIDLISNSANVLLTDGKDIYFGKAE